MSANAGLRTLNLAEQAGPSPELARAYANVALVAGLVPIHPIARYYSNRAKRLARSINQQTLMGFVQSRTSLYQLVTANWRLVDRSLIQAISISERFRDWHQMGESLILLAISAFGQGKFAESQSHIDRLYDLGRRTGNVQHQAWALNGHGFYHWQDGNTAAAITALEQALPLFKVSSDVVAEIVCHEALALAYLRAGQEHNARQSNKAASHLVAKAPPTPLSAFADYIGVALVYLTLWESSQSRPQSVQAMYANYAKRAYRFLWVYAWVFPAGQARIWIMFGLYHWLSGKQAKAHRAWAAKPQNCATFEDAL